MKIAIYSRKSKFTGKGESIENQIQLCKNYAISRFDATDKDFLVYEDEGFSGGNVHRPQFQILIKDAKRKKFDMLICYRLDRISRSVMDFSNTFETLENNGIGFVSIKEQFDTSSPMGKAMLYISSVFAQLERETAAERIRDNMLQLAKTGRWLGGVTPTGYESEQVTTIDSAGKERKLFKLSPIEEEINIVKLIFDKYIEFKSLTKVEQYLVMNDIKTKNNVDYTRHSIKAILANPVYVVANKTLYDYMVDEGYEVFSHEADFTGEFGTMVYNKTDQSKKGANRFRVVSEWIAAVGKHKAIIDSDTWIKAQKLLYRNKSKHYRNVKNTQSLLSGILYCSCGSYMRPKMGRVNKDGEQVFYYMCEMKEKSKRTKCNVNNVKGNDLDKIVVKQIKELATANSDLKENIENDQINIKTTQNKLQTDVSVLEANIKKNEESIKNIVKSIAEGQPDSVVKHLLKQIENLDKETAEMKERLSKLKESVEENQIKKDTLDVMGNILTVFKDSIDEVDVEAKRTFMKSIVKKITWNGENAEMTMFGIDTKK